MSSKREPIVVTLDDEDGVTIKYRIKSFGFRKANILFLKYLPLIKRVMTGRKLMLNPDEEGEEGEGFDITPVLEALEEVSEDNINEITDCIMESTSIQENPEEDWRDLVEEDLDYDMFILILIEFCTLNFKGFLRIGNGFNASSLMKVKTPMEETTE